MPSFAQVNARVGSVVGVRGGGTAITHLYEAAVLADTPLAYRNLAGLAETFGGATRYQIGDASTVSAINASDRITLEGIVSMSTLGLDGTILGSYSGVGKQALFWYDTAGGYSFRGLVFDGNHYGLTREDPFGYSVVADTEYHVAYTYDGTGGRLYVNGVERDFAAYTGTIGSSITPYYVGDDGSGSRYLNGTGRGFAIYDKALSAERILAHYNTSGI